MTIEGKTLPQLTPRSAHQLGIACIYQQPLVMVVTPSLPAKTVAEFVAYAKLGGMQSALDPKSFTIATFARCGFANFSSIGIQIGGIGALAPTRRHDLARLGFRAMLAGTLANFVTATIAGFLL